ncbi:hypothetical protein MRB53_019471 [Persea americana]|uniref:Uncharacterized protein n=1 Tax=Persea americana TaxID=3435 RepID=A0ACC2KY73_PERAE|nr:hypothetical protein MRB53_019471 [Persea americana]
MSRFVVSVFLLLLLLHSYSGEAQGVENVVEPPHRFHAEPTHRFHKMNVRKLMLEDTLLEYDYGGPNTRHDPKRGKPGIGKNP